MSVVIDPDLLAESHRLLDQARMIAEAPAAQAGEIGRGHPDSQMPPGMAISDSGEVHRIPSTLEAVGGRINRAIEHDSDTELRAANRWATRELDALQHAPAGGAETPLEFGDRIVRDYENVLAGVVARAEMSSVTTVRKLREERGRDPRTGAKVAGKGLGGVMGSGG